jgi:UPF0755 protein
VSSPDMTRRRPRPVLADPSYRSPRSSRPAGVRILVGVVATVVVIALVAAAALYWSLHQPQASGNRTVMFHVGTGDSVATVAQRLHAEGLLSNALLFRLDARVHGLGGELKVGDYALRPNMSIDQTVSALTVYHADMIRITVPEGFRSEQIAQVLDRHHMSGAAFLREVQHPADLHVGILRDKPAAASLEGYLFPNTYDVPPGFSGKTFAQYMVRTLDGKFSPQMRAQARTEHLSIYQVLTLAAIVEREAKVPRERPIIASVYLNRLKIGMKLQADPTVQYAAGTKANWWPVLQTEAVNVMPESPYNTYTHAGLPPGPIANPGLASIQAVLRPAPTHYYYFVAKGNGEHAFASTYTQQLANEQKYASVAP